jgi:hypothetical protein
MFLAPLLQLVAPQSINVGTVGACTDDQQQERELYLPMIAHQREAHF